MNNLNKFVEKGDMNEMIIQYTLYLKPLYLDIGKVKLDHGLGSFRL